MAQAGAYEPSEERYFRSNITQYFNVAVSEQFEVIQSQFKDAVILKFNKQSRPLNKQDFKQILSQMFEEADKQRKTGLQSFEAETFYEAIFLIHKYYDRIFDHIFEFRCQIKLLNSQNKNRNSAKHKGSLSPRTKLNVNLAMSPSPKVEVNAAAASSDEKKTEVDASETDSTGYSTDQTDVTDTTDNEEEETIRVGTIKKFISHLGNAQKLTQKRRSSVLRKMKTVDGEMMINALSSIKEDSSNTGRLYTGMSISEFKTALLKELQVADYVESSKADKLVSLVSNWIDNNDNEKINIFELEAAIKDEKQAEVLTQACKNLHVHGKIIGKSGSRRGSKVVNRSKSPVPASKVNSGKGKKRKSKSPNGNK